MRSRRTLQEHQLTLKNKDISLIKQEEDPNFFKVKFLNCGHVLTKRLSSLQKHFGCCDICKDLKFKKEAEDEGLILIGPSEIPRKNQCDYRLFKFANCGHFKEATLNSVRKGDVRCEFCFKQEIEKLCSDLNFKYVDKSHKCYFKASCNTCGEIKTIQYSNIRAGRVRCTQCSNDCYLRYSFVYVFKITFEDFVWLKIGHSNNPYLRQKKFDVREGSNVEFLFKKRFNKKNKAMLVEKAVMNKFKDQLICPETMRVFMTNGFSECYTFENLEEIILEIKNHD